MDFFEHQENARKRTKLLVFYYALAVAFIIVSIYLVLAAAMFYYGNYNNEAETVAALKAEDLWAPEIAVWTILLVGSVIGGGTIFKVSSLSEGGKSVAKMMGGKPIPADTDDFTERRLLNIVEEMAIASGLPVPPVYVIEDNGINAFAAGFKPSDAVIGITRGALDKFDRDELQGVIAHEFSHLVNGDMRLNIRLIGVLFGILLITVVGRFILHITFFSGGRRRSGRNKGGGGVLAMMAFAIILMIIGAIGVFFGRLIKSAVSRQREFLADASAVQFTRNPDGIAGALKKIGGYTSRVDSIHAEEASHMFFANSLRSSMTGLLATHPPLAERIRRIDQHFKGAQGGQAERAKAAAAPGTEKQAAGVAAFAGETSSATSQELTSKTGSLDHNNLNHAAHLIKRIPESVRSAVRSAAGARAAVYSLLLSRAKQVRNRQLAYLEENMSEKSARVFEEIRGRIEKLPVRLRMPLVDLSLTALQQQSGKEYRNFKESVDQLIYADQDISVFEFALSRSLLRNLEPIFGKPQKIAVLYYRIKHLIPHCLPLLAILAWFGNDNNSEQAAADFAVGVEKLGIDPVSFPLPELPDNITQTFSDALDHLQTGSAPIKKRILEACAASVAGNHKITVQEAELLRAAADSLDCPIPPLTGFPEEIA